MLNTFLAFLVFLIRLSYAYLHAIFRLFVSPSKVCVRNKVVVLTGSGSGLGRQLALGLAAEGARLVLWDISESGNKQTAGLIRADFPDAELHLYTVDVTDKELVKTSALRVQSELGEVYMLVNNAGVLVGESLLDLKEEDIERTININLLSAFWTLRAFLPAMLQSNHGHIVTTCSMSAINAMHRLADYSASKAGIQALDEALELELRDVYRKTGIKQTLICPHFLNTGLIQATQQRGTGMRETNEAADVIVDGILQQKRFVFFPKIFTFASTLKGLLPHNAALALLDFLQIRIPSQRLGRPHED